MSTLYMMVHVWVVCMQSRESSGRSKIKLMTHDNKVLSAYCNGWNLLPIRSLGGLICYTGMPTNLFYVGIIMLPHVLMDTDAWIGEVKPLADCMGGLRKKFSGALCTFQHTCDIILSCTHAIHFTTIFGLSLMYYVLYLTAIRGAKAPPIFA